MAEKAARRHRERGDSKRAAADFIFTGSCLFHFRTWFSESENGTIFRKRSSEVDIKVVVEGQSGRETRAIVQGVAVANRPAAS